MKPDTVDHVDNRMVNRTSSGSAKSFIPLLKWMLSSPVNTWRTIVLTLKVWRWVSSFIPLGSFFQYIPAHLRYGNIMTTKGPNPNFGSRIISPEEASTIPDNSERFDKVVYTYKGLSRTKSMIDKKMPVAFIKWHHGALEGDFAITRIIPQVACFTFVTFQFGNVFSYAMDSSKALSLFKIDRFLNEGRPISYHLDGTPLGECITLKIFGIAAEFSTAPINIIRNVEGIKIVPVTSYYEWEEERETVSTIFHQPLLSQDVLRQKTDREILEYLISFFEKDLCKRAPKQILTGYLVERELLAKKTRAKRLNNRKKKI